MTYLYGITYLGTTRLGCSTPIVLRTAAYLGEDENSVVVCFTLLEHFGEEFRFAGCLDEGLCLVHAVRVFGRLVRG